MLKLLAVVGAEMCVVAIRDPVEVRNDDIKDGVEIDSPVERAEAAPLTSALSETDTSSNCIGTSR